MSAWARTLFRIFVWCCVLLLVLMVLGGFNFGFLFEIFAALAFGWWSFLVRVFPHISWNWDLVGMAVVGSALILLGSHRFFLWISRHLASARVDALGGFRWPWKWTWCALAAVGLTFLTGSAVVGTVHQAGWVIGGREPWLEPKGRAAFAARSEMRDLEFVCTHVLAKPDTRVHTVRDLLWREGARHPKSLLGIRQKHHLLAAVDDDGNVKSFIFFPRDTTQRERFGGFVTTKDDSEPLAAAAIGEWLKKHHARLVAL